MGSMTAKQHRPNKAAVPKPPAAARDWQWRGKAGLQVLQAKPLAQLHWLIHGFSSRPGGASALETWRRGKNLTEMALNLGFTDWDKRQVVLENRAKFYAALGAKKMSPITLRQIHSDSVHRMDESRPGGPEAARADALITRERGLLLVVQTADCVPILLADTKNRAVAAIHSGWRGTLLRIAQKALGRMRMEYGTRPEEVIAVLGPSIGRCCYQVGPEVARDFDSQFREAREWFDGPFEMLAKGENDPNWLPWLTMRPPGHAPPPPRLNLDLIAASRSMLAKAGVPAGQIFSTDLCTGCRADLFFSYRREGKTGRMMAAIGIR
jgi:YfiH family protein